MPTPPTVNRPPPCSLSPPRPPKRQRNMSPERASSASDADNETEGHLSEPSASQTPAPPKKKRTRTLTTPHQSAVLHALLAKSRFPTTAMREEVGRQIGLSARKVQIWFQNQRQKARRPQNDAAPLTRPPQFGPFPIITSSGAPASDVSHSASSSAQSTLDSAASLDSKPALSGPGIRHWSPSSYQRRTRSADIETPTGAPDTPLGISPHPRLSQRISALDSRAHTRGLSPLPTQPKPVETSTHFSGILPPITVHSLEPRSSTDSYVSATPSFPSHTFVNTVPHHDSPRSPARQTIPPPFVLQPQPQWDPLTFTPYTRPQFGTWLQPSGSSLSSAMSPVGAHDRVMHTQSLDLSRRRHPSLGSPSSPPIFPPPFSQHHPWLSAPAPSVSRQGHRRSDNEAREE